MDKEIEETNTECLSRVKSNILIRLRCYCPMRLYCDAHDTIEFGVGNVKGDIVIILPSYINSSDRYNKAIKVLSDVYLEITNKDIMEDCYITPIVKCNKYSRKGINTTVANACVHWIFKEINHVNPIKVICFNNDNITNRIYNYIYKEICTLSYNPNYENKDKLKNELSKIINGNL